MPKKTVSKFNADRWFHDFSWARELLGATPAELRDNIQRAKGNHESVLEFFLTELEEEGRRILKADLPSGITEALKLSDLELASREPETFLLTERQENAVAQVMRVFSIRNLLADLSDPFREVSEREIWEQITLEAMQLALAAVRGDFRANLWPHIKRGAAVLRGSKMPRQDNLDKVIIRELKARGLKQSPKEISANFSEEALRDPNAAIVYDVENNGTICWYDQRKRARATSFKTLRNRVTRIKKRLRFPD